MVEFVRRDSITGDDGKPNPIPTLTYGWAEGMHAEEIRREGLTGILPRWGHLYVVRHYLLVERTGEWLDTRTGEVIPEAAMLRTGAAAATAVHQQTRRVLDTLQRAPGLRRVHGVVTRPDLPGGVVCIGGWCEVWNDWRGFSVQPIRKVSDVDVWPFVYLVSAMFPIPWERKLFLDWIAFQFQHPGVKVHWAPLLLSAEHGVGKGTLVGAILALLHPRHRAEITTDVLMSDFNGWLKGKVLAFGDEVKSTDRMDVTNRTKTLITSPVVTINRKHMQPEEVDNICNFIFASNHHAPLAIEQQDRRYFVLRIADEDAARIKADGVCATFHTWFEDKLNRMRLLGWLQERDIGDFQPKGHAQMTRAKEEMLDQARPGWDARLTEHLEAGAGVFARDVATVEGIGDALRRAGFRVVPAQVREWCKRQGFAVLKRRWVPGAAVGERVKATVYVVRDARRWLGATRDEVVAELSRSVDFETDKAQAERLLAGA